MLYQQSLNFPGGWIPRLVQVMDNRHWDPDLLHMYIEVYIPEFHDIAHEWIHPRGNGGLVAGDLSTGWNANVAPWNCASVIRPGVSRTR